MTLNTAAPSSFPQEKAGAVVSPQHLPRLALTFYGIAEYTTVIDHCEAMRRAGIHLPPHVVEQLRHEQRHLITHACYLLQMPMVATTRTDKAMVRRAREWLAEHPEHIDQIERGGEST